MFLCREVGTQWLTVRQCWWDAGSGAVTIFLWATPGDPLGQWVSFQCPELDPNLCVWCWSAPSGCWKWVMVAITDTQAFLPCPCVSISDYGNWFTWASGKGFVCFVIKKSDLLPQNLFPNRSGLSLETGHRSSIGLLPSHAPSLPSGSV